MFDRLYVAVGKKCVRLGQVLCRPRCHIEHGMGHTKRLKNLLLKVVSNFDAGNILDNDGKQSRAVVGIDQPATGRPYDF